MVCHENFDLTNFNSYRVFAICKRAIMPENEVDVVDYYERSAKNCILLGSGHNIILSKPFYNEDFIIFNGNYSKIVVNGTSLEVEAGASMFEVSKVALENSLSGLEIFHDIPSSLGGAIVMNAGASGEEIKDVLIKVRYLDLEDKKVKEIFKEDISFEYRNSFFQRNQNKVILKAWLALAVREEKAIREKMEAIKLQRWAKQPKDFPNAGSVFKRPSGFYVGAMMDELGLKGLVVGGAMVSEKHGGFIINFNNATGQDIISLIDIIKERVKEYYKIDLEVEQRIV